MKTIEEVKRMFDKTPGPAELEKIAALSKRATPAPWTPDPWGVDVQRVALRGPDKNGQRSTNRMQGGVVATFHESRVDGVDVANIELTAELRNYADYLLTAVRRRNEAQMLLRSVLELINTNNLPVGIGHGDGHHDPSKRQNCGECMWRDERDRLQGEIRANLTLPSIPS